MILYEKYTMKINQKTRMTKKKKKKRPYNDDTQSLQKQSFDYFGHFTVNLPIYFPKKQTILGILSQKLSKRYSTAKNLIKGYSR